MKKEAIILLAHGSPRIEANEFILLLCQKIERVSGLPIRAAFLNEKIIKIDSVVESLIKEGYNHIKVFPYFLVPGDHTTTDIPAIYNRLKQSYPQVEINLIEAFGLSQQLPELIATLINKP